MIQQWKFASGLEHVGSMIEVQLRLTWGCDFLEDMKGRFIPVRTGSFTFIQLPRASFELVYLSIQPRSRQNTLRKTGYSAISDCFSSLRGNLLLESIGQAWLLALLCWR